MKLADYSKLLIKDFFDINSDCNIYCYDLDNNVTAANEHMLNMMKDIFGDKYNHKIISKPANKILDNLDYILEENKSVIASKKAMQFFNRVRIKNRFLIFVTIKAPIYDENNRVIGVFGISHILSSHEISDNYHEKLSARETQCLRELIKGKTAKEIAESMSLSSRTIESYLENIKSKLGCRNKSELMDKVYQIGLASLSDTPITSEAFKTGYFVQPDEDEE